MLSSLSFFFFNDTATTEIYTLSLHDALPICRRTRRPRRWRRRCAFHRAHPGSPSGQIGRAHGLNSSHQIISYAVFCLKKKKEHHHLYSHSPFGTPPSRQTAAPPATVLLHSLT